MSAKATFKAGGAVYALRFSFGALCHYEDITDGKSLVEGLVEVQSMGEAIRFKPLIAIIRAGLFDTHPDLTDEDVKKMGIEDVKGLIDAIGGAASAAFPDEDAPSGNARKGKAAA